jgi:hypothetical protein
LNPRGLLLHKSRNHGAEISLNEVYAFPSVDHERVEVNEVMVANADGGGAENHSQHDGWLERPLGDDMSRCSPPTFACWLLEPVLPDRYREAILGDLIEEYTLRIEATSRFTAFRWFWSQTCRSVPSMVWCSLRSRKCFISMSIAVGVYIFMGTLKFAADWIISKLVAPDQATYVVLAPIVFLTTTTIGGCVVARIRRGATMFLALIVMITVAILIGVKVCSIPVPWWYQFGFLTLGPLTVIITPSLVRHLKRSGVVT